MIKQLLAPTSLTSSSVVNSNKISASDVVGNLKIVVNYPNIVNAKTITVKVKNFTDAEGTGAKDIGTPITIAGGSNTANITEIDVNPRGEDGEFYGIELSYDNTTAIYVGAIAVYVGRYENR